MIKIERENYEYLGFKKKKKKENFLFNELRKN